MCGITGVVHWDGRDVEPRVLEGMATTLVHRGPDEHGFYFNRKMPAAGIEKREHTRARSSVGLAHRRLSIIDLSTGQQPLCNEDGTVWIVFNGEIYNFLQLKSELVERGHQFRTNSDTEAIVHAYEEWGAKCLPRLNGMFAFAIWDTRQEQLFLARDRIGKKPLYYYSGNDTLIFGSELKAMLAYPGLETQLDPTAVADYFKYLYVPDPKTIFTGIFKLPPAHYLVASRGKTTIEEYWDVRFEDSPAASDSELEEQLFDLLEHAVRDRLMAEVPLGAFLSGGVDSSGVVALMARHSAQSVLTCSIGFDDPEHDESRHAAEVAGYLGTQHSEYFVRDNFLDTIRRLPAMFDEPFADSSAVPTFHVCRMARQKVTVALSGDGGDETFGGYDKYVKDTIERLCGRFVPALILRSLNAACGGRSHMQRRARTLTAQALRSPDRAYYESNTFISDRDLDNLLSPELGRQIKGYDPFPHLGKFFNKDGPKNHLSRMLYTDLKTYLPGDVLVKVDRTSMANSLEVRAPLLDYRIVEFASALTNRLKIRRGNKKYLLKKAFSRVLPEQIFKRPKHGFTVPVDAWFRNDLVPLAEEAFFATPAISDLLNVDRIRQIWDEHRTRKAEHGTLLWSTLMFSLWYRDLRCSPQTKEIYDWEYQR